MLLPLWYVADSKPQRWMLQPVCWLKMEDVVAKVADGKATWGWAYTEQLADVIAMVVDGMTS